MVNNFNNNNSLSWSVAYSCDVAHVGFPEGARLSLGDDQLTPFGPGLRDNEVSSVCSCEERLHADNSSGGVDVGVQDLQRKRRRNRRRPRTPSTPTRAWPSAIGHRPSCMQTLSKRGLLGLHENIIWNNGPKLRLSRAVTHFHNINIQPSR